MEGGAKIIKFLVVFFNFLFFVSEFVRDMLNFKK